MQEEYRFLDLNGERIFAGFHYPARPAARAVVICHPLGEEKLWAHRVLVSLARDLASAGLMVMRIDFRGEGDSDRAFEQSDLETRIEDASLAIDTLRQMHPAALEVTLLGLRLGAGVAAATAARRSDVSRLILWDPVIDGAAYMQTVLRLNLMYQMALHHKVVENRDTLVARLADGETVNIEGYELAEPLFRQVSALRLAEVLRHFSGETLIVQIHQGQAEMKAELVALAGSIERCRLTAAIEEPFWKEIKTYYHRASDLTRITLQALVATP